MERREGQGEERTRGIDSGVDIAADGTEFRIDPLEIVMAGKFGGYEAPFEPVPSTIPSVGENLGTTYI